MWMGTKDKGASGPKSWPSISAPGQSGWPAAHRRCQMREITATPPSFNSIYLYPYLYSFLPSSPSILFFLIYSPFHPPVYLHKPTYPSISYLSFLLEPLLFFVYFIVVCPNYTRHFSGNYLVPSPYQSTIIHLFINDALVSCICP